MAGERPDCEERPVDGARVERAERAVREQVIEELEVGAQLVPSSSGVGLDVLVERDELRARDLVCVLQERPVAVVLDGLLGERRVVLAREVLADLGDVQLREVLRVAAVKDLLEPLRLLVDLLRGVRRARLGRRPVRRPHADVKDLAPRLIRDDGVSERPLHVCVWERLIF